MDVKSTKEAAFKLGNNVKVSVIPGAMHDIFASPTKARSYAFDAFFEYLSGKDI